MLRFQQLGKALGSEVVLTVIVKHESEVGPIFQALWALITSFEKRFSRFLPDSELSHFNLNAGRPTPISRQFHELLISAQKYSNQTDGLYNPFILPSLQQAGYIGSWPQPDNYNQRLNYSKRQLSDHQQLVIKPTTAHIPAASALDFGGIGKGYLLDELADYLEKSGFNNYWLSLGGDIICNGRDHRAEDWKIGVADAHDDSIACTTITNHGQRLGVATSGTTIRKGQGWHHIIDPRTGRPAETDVLTATLAAPSATTADVFAKCLVILGSTSIAKFLETTDYYAVVQTVAQSGKQALQYGKTP